MQDLSWLDNIQLNFSPEGQVLMNYILAFIMFGVALEIKADHFKELMRNPKGVVTGLISQFLLLPLITLGLVYLMRPHPTLALGMFLLAAVPGGNISNFMTHLARGNAALSVSLTAFSSTFSIVLTPLNFAFWSGLYAPTAEIMTKISLDALEVFKIILLLLVIPLIAGLFFAKYLPKITGRITGPIKNLSMLIFIGFVIVIFQSNYDTFLQVIKYVVVIVAAHHTSGLLGGFYFAKFMGLPFRERKTIAIETAIQNSGLGLILCFNFFPEFGATAIACGWWSIWHIAIGLSLSYFWSRYRMTLQPNHA
jgi:BASS family bile acid:Na+ symporter